MDQAYLPKDASILIVGAGTFGLSTAVHLARRGYTNIQCVDRFPYPSPDSAGFDINKIVSLRNDTPMYSRMTREALAGWQDEPILAPVWHEVGMVTTATSEETTDYCRRAYQGWIEGGEGKNVRWLENKEDFAALVPQVGGLSESNGSGWRGFYHQRAGWADADRALRIFGDEAKKNGVRFSHGPSATMHSLLLNDKGEAKGIVAQDGTELLADCIVLCTGAWTDSLIDTESQLEARCWTLAHLQLTPDECAQFKGIPVVLNLEEGTY